MKFGFLLLILLSILLLGSSFAHAGDESCQVDLLKPKINASVIIEEADKPAKLTVNEARLRLQKSQIEDDAQVANDAEQDQKQDGQDQNEPESTPTHAEKVTAKTTKKTSRLGGIFDILLPSKLRDPVK